MPGDHQRNRPRPAAAAERARRAPRPCAFCEDRSAWVDYKDTALLGRFMSDRGKIRPRWVNGNCARHQRDVAVAIKSARELALLPYAPPTPRDRGPGRTPRGNGSSRGERIDVQPSTVDESRTDAPIGDIHSFELEEVDA